jgi:hypothetical protein
VRSVRVCSKSVRSVRVCSKSVQDSFQLLAAQSGKVSMRSYS